MTHMNYPVSEARTDDFMSASLEDKGILLCLLIYCTEQQNQGIIKGCAKWSDMHWQRAVGLSLNDVKHSSTLWNWSGDSIIVPTYNHKHEHLIESRKRGAAITNQKRMFKKLRVVKRSPSTVQSLSDTLSASQERKKERKTRPSATTENPTSNGHSHVRKPL